MSRTDPQSHPDDIGACTPTHPRMSIDGARGSARTSNEMMFPMHIADKKKLTYWLQFCMKIKLGS